MTMVNIIPQWLILFPSEKHDNMASVIKLHSWLTVYMLIFADGTYFSTLTFHTHTPDQSVHPCSYPFSRKKGIFSMWGVNTENKKNGSFFRQKSATF